MWCTFALAAGLPVAATATTPLGDQPVFSATGVPGNLALVLSVEFPTAVSVAHLDGSFNEGKTYLGYFDPKKCYGYSYNADETLRHFYPAGLASNGRKCKGGQGDKWAGNFLNWATTQTIDPFRWALTGGYRSVDTTTLTLVEKAWASGQGGTGNFPNRSVVDDDIIKDHTPLDWSRMDMRVQGLGNKLRFTRSGNVDGAATVYQTTNDDNGNTVYEVSVRVKVCDSDPNSGPMEANCTAYPSGTYKPTGLIQEYASKIRYSAFGYLNDSNINRDGGVLRAKQKYVGPTYVEPGQVTARNSPNPEWDPDTGIIHVNPNGADATATATLFGVPVGNSGVINYLNKFGQIAQSTYKTYDPVGELYYAAVRYFKNLGNVPEWTDMTGADAATKATWVDGFPVITNWDDPILYSCQRNFALGIGDVNTHADKNLPGPTSSATEPSKPSAVAADTSVDAVAATNKVGALHGLGASLGTTTNYGGCCNNNAALMAGLAYDANTVDMRPDDATKPQTAGKQTMQTYWLDVLEYSTYKQNNQYYLATKYGGFRAPKIFDPYTRATDIPVEWWNTGGEQSYGQTKPDNYFVAAKPDDMVSGLKRAFASIAANLRAYTTSFATALPQVSNTGSTSYSAQYDAGNWTGELSAATTTFSALTGEPATNVAWTFSDKLATQLANGGWDTGRVVATYNTATGAGVPFRIGSLSTSQKGNLNTVYRAGDDSADYLNYLRGEPKHEENSSDPASERIYRSREKLVGDIVGSKPRAVGPPSAPFSSAANPGYGSFKTDNASRPTIVYVGSNSGMLHAVKGSIGDADSGTELFAYVPGSLYAGPNNAPQVSGLAHRGDPDFTHRHMVDASPAIFDIDFGRTQGGSGTDWRTVLVGGLGKGGRAYYALDVTNPATLTSEAAVAGKVLWEFKHTDLGYTYGEPISVKTKKHGWVLIFGSGYNNSDGKGYFFIVNPRTGALIEKIGTGAGAPTAQAGLAHAQAFVPDRTDNTADSVYAGDLLGNVWRLDLRGTPASYPAPTLLARLLDNSNLPRSVTSRPLVTVQPTTGKRWVAVGTGRLLDSTDVGSTQSQALYAVMDGTSMAFNATAPAGFSFPIGSNKLKELTDLTQPVVLNTASEIGWYVDLGLGAGLGWRVINDPSAFYGAVEFTTMLPNGDACNPSGTSRVYAIDLGTGQSTLVAADGETPIAYSTALAGMATEQKSYSVAGKRRFIACSTAGTCTVIKTKKPPVLALKRLNWRELPLAN